ncbi:DUF3169 family protein [Bacillus sp. AFS019443]|uniref:DUF3169 family protein n=1 Tax=Bacillus sp. AFS019443 TaxID=2034279 RepID=UPI000BF30218|nr:DUF3169 family protein [Bacillus sp. AFS019443]PEU13327.1 DUF3169 domain-containing protein [Bacillus sp. AFS019443]
MENRLKHMMMSIAKLLGSMLIGLIIGYVFAHYFGVGSEGDDSYTKVIVLFICCAVALVWFGKNMWTLTKLRDEEENEQGRRLGSMLIYLRVSEVIVWSWAICAAIMYYRSFAAGTPSLFEVVNFVVSIVCLILVIWIGFIMKNRYNKLYPEQRVTYSQSMEMWARNADEGQQHIVHEAGYKAYQFTNIVLAWAWILSIGYTIVREADFFLIGMISFVWVLHIGKYMYEMHRKMIY